MKKNCKCKLTVQDKTTGKKTTVTGTGTYWNLIADKYERDHPNKKVVCIEGA